MTEKTSGTRGPKPTSNRKPVTYKINPGVAAFARQYARYNGMQIADLIEEAITDWCAMHEPDGPRKIIDSAGTSTIEPPEKVHSLRVREYQLARRSTKAATKPGRK